MRVEQVNWMKIEAVSTLVLSLLLPTVGCQKEPVGYGETTKSFIGAVVKEGNAITLPQDARLDLVHDETYSRFGIPLQQDGTFKIGWMPIGKYSGELVWLKGAVGGDPNPSLEHFKVPNGLVIEKDKTEYTVDLGSKWEP